PAPGKKHVLRREHFRAMKPGAMVCNSGHFDIEIDLVGLGEESPEGKRTVNNFVDEHALKGGKRVYGLGEGRLINLAAAHGHPASVMDMSFATQALASEWAVKNRNELTPKVYEVPIAVEIWVAKLKLAR